MMDHFLNGFLDFLTEKMNIIAPWIINILFTLFAPLFLFLTVFPLTCCFAMIGLFILYILTRPFVFIGRLLHISIPDEVQDKIDNVLMLLIEGIVLVYFSAAFLYLMSIFWPPLAYSHGLLHGVLSVFVVAGGVYFARRIDKAVASRPENKYKWYPRWK